MAPKVSIAVFSVLILPVLIWGQSAPGTDVPRIGAIDVFGLSKVKDTNVRTALGVKEGDALPPSKGDAEDRVNGISGIVESHLEAVCCDASNRMVLYVGVEERGAPHFDLREPPEGDASLAETTVSLYRDLLQAIESASRRGAVAEDLTQGHPLMADPLAREIQIKFPDIAKDQAAQLRRVLRTSADEEQRAVAVYVLGYASQKKEILDDLQYALRDSDAAVRANAVQALMAIAVYSALNPDFAVRVQPTWFVEMLNSLSWSDRDHALKALQVLTDKRDAITLDLLRERAMNSLVEMARWKALPHALPAYVLLGRVAGWSEAQIQDTWSKGDRESVIQAAMRKQKR